MPSKTNIVLSKIKQYVFVKKSFVSTDLINELPNAIDKSLIYRALNIWFKQEGHLLYDKSKFRHGAEILYSPKKNPTVAADKSTYVHWSYDGVFCEIYQQDCLNCAITKYGYQLGEGCYQPIANEILKEKGIEIPQHLIDKVVFKIDGRDDSDLQER